MPIPLAQKCACQKCALRASSDGDCQATQKPDKDARRPISCAYGQGTLPGRAARASSKQALHLPLAHFLFSYEDELLSNYKKPPLWSVVIIFLLLTVIKEYKEKEPPLVSVSLMNMMDMSLSFVFCKFHH